MSSATSIAFYRERAAQCQRDADATDLTNVRDRQLASRDVWLDMADKLEQVVTGRAEKAGAAVPLVESSFGTLDS